MARYAAYIALFFITVIAPALGQPTFREKIGQMIMLNFTGTTLTPATVSASIETLKVDLAQRNLGGVLLFAYNATGPAQLQTLTAQLQQAAPTPLFIAIDQEGGSVARLSAANGFTATNSHAILGSLNSETSTRATAALMAGWLKEGGINVNFAPVVDVNVNPNNPIIGSRSRSFSADPMAVARHAGWFMDEFAKRKVVTTLKHFPGHGSSTADSHYGFTDITTTWTDSELTPYRELFAQNAVEMLMTGHLYNARLDTIPATLSKIVLDSLLRGALGYNGIVVSDAMLMGAIRNYYSFEESVVKAVNAGVDILLYTTNLTLESPKQSYARLIIETIERNVANGTIPASRIDESYARIKALKNKVLANVYAEREMAPRSYRLAGFPNPFNSATNLQFTIERNERVTLTVNDLLGREVARLTDGMMTPGTHTVRWNAAGFASGIYLARLVTASGTTSQRLVLMK